ncbi:MAG: hypothetical protein ACI9DG_002385 [Oleispira sp.]
MNIASTPLKQQSIVGINKLSKHNNIGLAASSEAEIWTSFYEQDVQIATWQRTRSIELNESVDALLELNTFSQLQFSSPAQNVVQKLAMHMPQFKHRSVLLKDIALLSDMFACLFDQDNVGLRLKVLDTTMCPRFHVDQVPCRLLTTYRGPATEWLPNESADRNKLGAGNQGLSDDLSGLFQQANDIESMNAGDVALLKGEAWQGNEGRGLIHRSPINSGGHKRLLLTLDFA